MFSKNLKHWVAAAGLLTASSFAQAANDSRTICIFDPVGNSGDMYALMKDYRASFGWDKNIEMQAVTDESVLAEELKAGTCDGALMTGIKARPFNRFSATLEAVRGTTNRDEFRKALNAVLGMQGPKAEKYLRQGEYEVAAILPAGSIYAFTSDRSMRNVAGVQGRKIAVIDGDRVSQSIIKEIGASPVMATTTSFAGKFNNGSVDLVFSPAVAYQPLELYRGLGENGGVSSYSFLQLTFQLIVRWERFPKGFAEQTRQASLGNLDRAFEYVDRAEDSIPDKYWVDLTQAEQDEFRSLLRDARIKLRDKGVYHGDMLRLLRIIRCKSDPSRAECSENLE
ncbi:MAG: putative solute-binding protein [Pseudomonadota bacterium]